MKKKLLGMVVCCIFIFGMTGCTDTKKNDVDSTTKESFMLGTTLDDGRVVHFTFDIPYKETSLVHAFPTGEITFDEFIRNLEHVSDLKDGGSILYRYNKKNETFGDESFYTIVCNSLDGNHDIYIAKYRENVIDKCNVLFDDLDNVSMTIKEGTLTDVGATVIITDTSDRENIYGSSYYIDKKENGVWVSLVPKIELIFTSIGYTVGEDYTLEFDINWEDYYGHLDGGEYRIVKDTSEVGDGVSHYITVSFTIED